MASPSLPEKTYHVFLSFRGPDSRDNLASHFYANLDEAGIHTYLDSEELKKGERISDALPMAIEDSSIALVVFSERYATSRWCLQEVTKIMKCKDADGLLVLPVFLKVKPREVRKGRDSYKRALDEYEKDCKDGKEVGFSLDDVNDWRDALNQAGQLSGWVYNDGDFTKVTEGTPPEHERSEFKDEAAFVRDVVQHISERLERIPLYVEDVVGMLSQVENVKSILDMRSADEEVQDRGLMVGLWGMGCTGKTILAKLIYNSIFKEFQGAAFLEIPSDSENLTSLQETMLRTLLTHAKLRVTNRHGGIASMKDRLKTKRILLILDGVDDIRQIDGLIGKRNDILKNGSRIIVTTRNKRLLLKRDAAIYEVKALEDHEARRLFLKCASENGVEEISEDHVERALQCTGRVPFALQRLGSCFCGKDDEGRKTELEKFGSWSDPIIHEELVRSLVGLDDTTRGIFLDIACFFNGWNRKYVERFLGVRHVKRRDGDSNDVVASKANDHVNDLVERSLITAENGTLQVHPLIELMGQKVADGELAHNLEKRRRLWCWDDVAKVLSEVEGEYDVDAIVLAPEEPQELENISSNTFKKLKKLRFLIMINVKVKTFPECIDLPSQLRWFEWPEFPASRLKFSHDPWHPAVLAVRKSLLLSNGGEP